MRYYYDVREEKQLFSETYACSAPYYHFCTLYSDGVRGLAVIMQRFSPVSKAVSYGPVPGCLANDIYRSEGFEPYFREHAGVPKDGVYPAVTARQIMWALRIKPLKIQPWERYFKEER